MQLSEQEIIRREKLNKLRELVLIHIRQIYIQLITPQKRLKKILKKINRLLLLVD